MVIKNSSLHPRSKHLGRYDFASLIKHCQALEPYVIMTDHGEQSIDFFDPMSVKMLNMALLMYHYQLDYWDIPAQYLCPSIPGRADYIHYVADLLAQSNKGKVPTDADIKCLDIGVGANCIYPIIGHQEYAWSFVGADIDTGALASAQNIIDHNPSLQKDITLRLQKDKTHFFEGIIKAGESYDVSICNPPFHASEAEANAGTLRKLQNLKGSKKQELTLNFAGQSNELICEGGEARFIHAMICESADFARQCQWFTSLVSKESNLKPAYQTLRDCKAKTVKTIEMRQGQKVSRLLAWQF